MSRLSNDARPVTGPYRVIPLIAEPVNTAVSPLPAEPDVQQALGFPGALPDNWKAIALQRLDERVKSSRALRVFLDTCTRCGACTDKCHYFLGTQDPKNMPVARQDLLRRVYRRYFTFAGKYFPWLVGARDLDESVLQDWYRYYHQCSQCRRCTVYCPKGIDTSEVTMAGRDILASIGIGQHYTQNIIAKAARTGNNLGIPPAAMADTLASLEEDMLEDTGQPVKLPLDDPEADMLLITPSADLFAEPHIDGLIGYAKVLHQAGIRWTLSSEASEAANFALFSGSDVHLQALAERIFSVVRQFGYRQLVVGECGHAWRVAYSLWPSLGEGTGDLPVPQHICEVTHDLLTRGVIELDPSRNAGKVVTFHDSCNVARGASMGDRPGGQFSIPRDLLRASCEGYVDMSLDTIGQKSFCCGGGGGLLSDELTPVRIAGALPRAEALQRVVDAHGVTHMAAICAICKTQFNAVLPAHGLGGVEIVSLHQLVGDALVMDETAENWRRTGHR